MGFWSKVKGVFGRIGKGIKNVATKAYNWITDNKDKIKQATDTFNSVTNDKYKNYTDKGQDYLNKGIGVLTKFGVGK